MNRGQYLNRVCACVRFKDVHPQIRRELGSHFEIIHIVFNSKKVGWAQLAGGIIVSDATSISRGKIWRNQLGEIYSESGQEGVLAMNVLPYCIEWCWAIPRLLGWMGYHLLWATY
ncbi:MAG: hypothetical protein ABFC94_15835 [Syntrophomonas sp.]